MYSEWKCRKNILVFCNSFCKACCAFKSCMNKACWKSCCWQQIQTITLLTRGYKFQHRNLHQSVEILPIMQEVLLSEFFAGKSNFSKALLMQLLKAKEALQKELHNTNRFFEFFCPYSCLYACNCNSNPIGPQNIFFELFLPTMLVLHSKAAKTECLAANTGGGLFKMMSCGHRKGAPSPLIDLTLSARLVVSCTAAWTNLRITTLFCMELTPYNYNKRRLHSLKKCCVHVA